MQPVKDRVYLRDLRDPILLTAFNSQMKGGATAPSALAYAVNEWQAEPIADFEADECYNHARMRPWVRREGDRTVIDWPRNMVYRVDGPQHSYLILIGVEPSMNWREFVSGIGDFAARMGVRTAVNLKSVPAMVPHTLEAPVRAIYSTPELRHEYGFEELEDQDGPADIGRVLNLHLAAMGCRTIDLYAMEPFYAAAIPDAGAGVSLLRALKPFDLAVDVERLEEAAEVQRRAIDAAVSSSEQLRETVTALEQRAGARDIEHRQALLAAPEDPVSELDASDVIDEAEKFLRGLWKDNGDVEA